jgi:uncharacterized protein (TIGR03067 family)
MRARTLTALAIGLLLPAALLFADDKDKKKDIDALQGTWKVEIFKNGGQAAPEDDIKELKFIIKDNKYTLAKEGEEIETGTFKLDPEKKVKTIDLEIQSGQDKGKKQLGIYTLKEDTFIFCFAPPGETERPTKLESTAENKAIFSELKREKK